jgi:hypothetical protein
MQKMPRLSTRNYDLSDLPSQSGLTRDDSVIDVDAPMSLTNSSLANRRRARAYNSEHSSVDELNSSLAPKANVASSGATTLAPSLHGIDILQLVRAANHDHQNIIELGPLDACSPSPNIVTFTALTEAFSSPISLQLFQYFYQVASQNLVTMGKSGVNPILTLCTPSRLLDVSCAAAAALRMSILSVSLAHFSNQLRISYLFSDEEKASYQASIRGLGDKLKTAILANIVLVEEDAKDQFDTVLATCVLTMVRDVISADVSWHDNFDYAIRLVTKRGGPQAVLNEDTSNITRRFLLENLAAHDVFSCFITRKEPALMDRFDPWWYSCVESSSAAWEWESVERTFGVSRGMLEFLSRVVTLDAQKCRLGINFRQPTETLQKVEDFMQRQAEGLLMELDVWCNGLNSSAQHVRVKCGDYIYKYSANVYILASILDQPCSSTRIVKSIDYVLELCSEATALRQVVMLIWPLLICSSFCQSTKRAKILELVSAFEIDYCEDLQVAREVMLAQWQGMDQGLGRRSFNDIMKSIDKCVLLI